MNSFVTVYSRHEEFFYVPPYVWTNVSSRLSLIRLDVEAVGFRRIRCSSGAEPLLHYRNHRLLGQFPLY
jgi:hypothetical protein